MQARAKIGIGTAVTHRAAVPLAALLLVALAGCGGAPAPGGQSGQPGPGAHEPVATADTDWKGVADTLGRAGKLTDDNTVYRVALTRSDLNNMVSQGVPIKPGLSLGGYATFTKYDDTTMLMGDLVATESELPRVTDALQAHGIEQTALHKHLLEQSPPVWWTHIHGMGDPTQLAQGVRAALDATATPRAAAATQQPPIDLDTAGIDNALGRNGTADGGIYKFTIARNDIVTDAGHVLPPGTGVNTALNFQPVGGGRAVINGDFVLTAPEVEKVIQALRKGGIIVVELHNHSLTDQPRLFYLHFWAADDGVALAKTLRTAVDATNAKPHQ
ncbi:DUF1259 domain-containing protein [Saccharopolyspora phatthalungensis]|uniref:Peptidase M23B n=1 Tax=Saccharopolyspora phatthalungensis TaxID=664693 RepID=A0A840QJ54_9PSEU|nr:DUF1259 domain-containing protein [Saccharopolyspora phatthalungensis]MBB5159058.1 hypothetical protein [Saccharopolyspora phatthalungensis]